VETTPETLIIGAGVAGLRAAIALSDMGINVHVIEREEKAGGIIPSLGKMFPGNKEGVGIVEALLDKVRERENITLFTRAELVEKQGGVGKFEVRIVANGGESISLTVGSIIVATGFDTYTPDTGEFGFGLDGVVTLEEYKKILDGSKDGLVHKGKKVRTVAYVYCVGSREHLKTENAHTYCSRYCCSAAVHAALLTDQAGGGSVHQFHLFRDMRTYGKHELLYEQALQQGSFFIRFKDEEPPVVTGNGGQLTIRVKDQLSGGEEIEISPDLLVLVNGMIPRENTALIDVLKLPVGLDGFFNEIHPKLRPVETVIDGVFIAGAAQGPKTLAESVASSLSAGAKTGALLLKGYVDLEPLVARVDSDLCNWCNACLNACPYGAIEKIACEGREIAWVNTVLCKGEGACVSVCDAQAIDVAGFTNKQMFAMIDAMVKEAV
ncbi:MAG: CoB--CoM heterodisulfide reductase iron-sulfur subunit A family protein, partial [Syntrophaceae bacterium]|nr:CoB--CoM heterodisulfide reductase iron-sulfur subunit A family protein [Syntrophaceae bacterium]